MNKLDDLLKGSTSGDIDVPIYDTNLLGLGICIWKDSEWSISLCETFPYAPDGSVPLILIRIGKLDFVIESFWLYRLIYKKRYDITLIKGGQ